MIETPVFEFPTYMIVVEAKTEVRYTAQVGGLSCQHREAEGFLIPIPFIDYTDSFFLEKGKDMLQIDYEKEDGPYTKFACDGCYGGTLSLDYLRELQASIDRRSNKHDDFEIMVDESRQSESTEAWVPVIVIFKSGRMGGIMYLENCD